MRQSPAATLGMAALLSVAASLATSLITLELNHLRGTGRVPGAAAGGWLDGVNLIIGFAFNMLFLGLVAVVVGRSFLGVTTSLSEVWRLARPRLPAVVGTTGLLLLIFCALWIPFALVLAVEVGTGQPAVILLVLLAGLATVLAEVAGWTLLSTAAVVVVLERTGPAAALRRSWQLVRTSFWRILGILLLTALIYFVASEIIALPFIGAQLAVGGGFGGFHVSLLVGHPRAASAASSPGRLPGRSWLESPPFCCIATRACGGKDSISSCAAAAPGQYRPAVPSRSGVPPARTPAAQTRPGQAAW